MTVCNVRGVASCEEPTDNCHSANTAAFGPKINLKETEYWIHIHRVATNETVVVSAAPK